MAVGVLLWSLLVWDDDPTDTLLVFIMLLIVIRELKEAVP